jgi:hypothetical protein
VSDVSLLDQCEDIIHIILMNNCLNILSRFHSYFVKLKTTFIYIKFYNRISCWEVRVNISKPICFYHGRQLTIPKIVEATPIPIRIIPAVRTPNLGPAAPTRITIRPTIVTVKPAIIKILGKISEPPPRRWLTFFDRDFELRCGTIGCMYSK